MGQRQRDLGNLGMPRDAEGGRVKTLLFICAALYIYIYIYISGEESLEYCSSRCVSRAYITLGRRREGG